MAHAPIYLDYHSTTPVDERVLQAMLPFFSQEFGNAASSTHAWGWRARDAVEQARRDVADVIGAAPREIVFTSGATESNNMALRGVAGSAPPERRHIAVSAIEHKSVLEVADGLAHEGWDVTVVPVERDGRLSLSALTSAVTGHTALVSVMAANNEIGVVQPIAEVAAIAHAKGALFHVDAAQAVGKIPVDVQQAGIDLLSLTAHKICGPKGCGALFVRRRLDMTPLMAGGGHERGLRPGTLNVPGIVGLARACTIARDEMPGESVRVGRLRDRLLAGLRALDGVSVNGSLEHRLPNNLHVSFSDVDGESLLMGDAPVPSASIRFGLGRFTTEAEIDYAVEKFVAVVRHLRQMAPV
jgi:cysteine desulfurase